jgi:plastocyanin
MSRFKPARWVLVVLVSSAVAGCDFYDRRYPVYLPVGPPVNAVPPASGASVTITIVGINGNMSFSPNPAVVKVGQTIAWYNADPYNEHRILQGGGAFDAGVVPPGATTAPIQVNSAGATGYICTIHPVMTGTLTVTP